MTVLSSPRTVHVLVILFLLLELSPVVGFAAPTELTGEVSIPARLIAGQIIRVSLLGHTYTRTTVTRVDGSFSFEDVPPGDYVIQVDCPGYEPGSLELQNWSAGELRQIVVPLGRPINRDNLPVGPDATTTVKELKVPPKAIREMSEAQAKSKRQDYDGAIAHLKKAVQIYPNLADAWNNLGVAYVRVGRDADAESAFKRAISSDPTCPQALMNLGLLYIGQERNREAIEPLEAFLKGNSTEYRLQTYLAVALYEEGKYREAETWLQRALSAKPDFTDALFQLAVVQFRLEDYQGAAESADRFLASAPNDANAGQARQLKAAADSHATKSAE